MTSATTLLLWIAGVRAFGRLTEKPDGKGLTIANEAMALCEQKLLHALGPEWFECVVHTLTERQEAAKAAGHDDYYPIVPHTFSPWTADHGSIGSPGYFQSEELKNWMRDYTCDAKGPGNGPLRTSSWKYLPPAPCIAPSLPKEEAAMRRRSGLQTVGEFMYRAGYLPGGNDLAELNGQYTEKQAAKLCSATEGCEGFTFSASSRPPDATHTVYFKNYSDNVGQGEEWHTFKKRANPSQCKRAKPPSVETYEVHILRESPPVFVVPNFLGDADCQAMIDRTVPHMTPSVVSGGSTSYERRSYSVNMYPDFDDNSNEVTQLSRKLFRFAREVAGYTNLHENDGQEPVNAVFYKDYDDQYRAHCDGECRGGPYKEGKRIASALTYCETPVEGGATLFTRSGLKVVPQKGSMLFFGYKLNGSRMDAGHTEHSGCPLRQGRKWIATMWFREGVTPERNWQAMRDL